MTDVTATVPTQVIDNDVVLQDLIIQIEDLVFINDVVLQDLIIQIEDLVFIVERIARLRDDNLFRFLSKQSRNELLQGLVEKSGSVDDAAKAAHRSLKKIKRERLPENIADLLLSGQRQHAVAAAVTVSGNPVSESE
jgi:hypothetical protein